MLEEENVHEQRIRRNDAVKQGKNDMIQWSAKRRNKRKGQNEVLDKNVGHVRRFINCE